jgi:16S rRNA (guanine966-N2)-methyltransferase
VRIISGARKGKRISAPGSLPVRPTTDFAKEALFNILRNHVDFPDITVLDLFAGTGNISYEFASRGAADILAIDSNPACIKFIIHTAQQLEFHMLKAMRSDVFHFLSKSSSVWDIIFADPPFDFERHEELPEVIFENGKLSENGMLIIEHSVKTAFGHHPNHFDTRKYGSVCFSFFKNNVQKESVSY